VILRLGQAHFPEVSGLAGDYSEDYAWHPAGLVSLDVDLKRKENCYYDVAGLRAEVSGEPANWQHAIEL